MATTAYKQWVASVRANGGRVATAPSGTPSAAYPISVWGPRANQGAWPMPNELGNADTKAHTQVGYYHAPAALQDEIRMFSVATEKETEGGAKGLMQQWGIPTMFQSLGNYVGSLLLIGGVVAGVVFLVKRSDRTK